MIQKTYRELMNYGITLEKIILDVTLIQYLLEASDSSKPISEILSEYTEFLFFDGIEKEGQLILIPKKNN